MKKFILSLTLMAFICSAAHAATPYSDSAIKTAVMKYKAQNYVGCLQDMEDLVKKDPKNAFAYYYQGLALTQLGKYDQAKTAYTKVIDLSNSIVLMDNSTKALKCLDKPNECMAKEVTDTELDQFIKTTRFLGNSVQADVNKKKLNKDKFDINHDEYDPPRYKSEMPTNDEIAEAVKVLARAGINPFSGMNTAAYGGSSELAQMNMLMGNNNNNNNGNSMNNMLPMLMMGQNGQNNISPEMIQTMMMSNMTSDYGYGSSTY